MHALFALALPRVRRATGFARGADARVNRSRSAWSCSGWSWCAWWFRIVIRKAMWSCLSFVTFVSFVVRSVDGLPISARARCW